MGDVEILVVSRSEHRPILDERGLPHSVIVWQLQTHCKLVSTSKHV